MKERSPAPEQQVADRSVQRREQSGSVGLLDLQRSAGNHATAGLVAGAEHGAPVGTGVVQRIKEKIEGESVEVSFKNRKKEKAEAAAIIKEIRDKYGIKLD